MKHKILAVALTALFAAGCFISYRSYTPENNLSAVTLQNIEALANEEAGSVNDQISCNSQAKRDVNHCYIDCAECTRIEGWKGEGSTGICTRIR